ncbi:MAG: leucine-rich repeat-containing protein kinase family protein [Verrucomicrobiota bacterium]
MHTLSQLRAGELTGITRLDLRGDLTEFPREILDLADTLEILNLSGNRLSELPDDFARLHKLRILFCSDNDFRHLPAVLGECAALEMVGFKANLIETVDEAAFPPLLRWLILTDNRIGALPGSIGRCGRLQKLMLAGNRLEDLPESMAACVKLELIRLAANRFREFPQWLFELPRLSWLALAGNPWSEVSGGVEMPEICWTELHPEEQLGEGASGVIHRARWQERPVAVKIFKGTMTSDGLPDQEMAACLAAGSHPNLIGVLGKVFNHPDGRNGLVMPLVDPGFVNLAGPPDFESCTRDVYAADRRFRLAGVLRKMSALASAARHLHERGIAHGDFYAHNILRNADGDCLLGDFGAASLYPREVDFERIEVRAFGCLLEELLERVEFEAGDREAVEGMWKLQESCVAEVVRERPGFDEIWNCLESIQVR